MQVTSQQMPCIHVSAVSVPILLQKSQKRTISATATNDVAKCGPKYRLLEVNVLKTNDYVSLFTKTNDQRRRFMAPCLYERVCWQRFLSLVLRRSVADDNHRFLEDLGIDEYRPRSVTVQGRQRRTDADMWRSWSFLMVIRPNIFLTEVDVVVQLHGTSH